MNVMGFGAEPVRKNGHLYGNLERSNDLPAIGKGWGVKLTGRLADYANASKGTLLLGDIQAHMMKEHAKPSNRRQDIIHPSELAKSDWCPRSTYYRIKACREADNPYLKPTASTGVQLLNIFDEGHYIHDKWQKRLRDMGDLWGNWECPCGDGFWKNCLPPVCGCIPTKSLIYREVPLYAEQYLISGHADGAIPRLKSLIEIKSVGTGTVRISAPKIYDAHTDGAMIDLQGLWKAIKEPFPDHVRQGQLYLTLCSLMGLDYTQIIFLYESKFNQGAKEFVVKYDPSYCDDILNSCAEIVQALIGESTPQCPTGTSCKDCEIYNGAEKSSTEGLGSTEHSDGIKSTRPTIKRSSGSSTRIVRSS